MKILGLKCMVRMKKYRFYKGQTRKIAPNQKWTTDITEIFFFGTKRYLFPILDMYNGEIVSYSINEYPVLNHILNMLDKAFLKILDDTNLFHSTQG